MLNDKDVYATVAVRDLATAKEFYGGTLGLQVVEDMEPGALVYRSGRSRLLVYVSEYAGNNQATVASWDVGDSVDELVRSLKARGVVFEHYDLPDTTREGDVHVSGSMRIAWLKDPEGNILSLAGTG